VSLATKLTLQAAFSTSFPSTHQCKPAQALRPSSPCSGRVSKPLLTQPYPPKDGILILSTGRIGKDVLGQVTHRRCGLAAPRPGTARRCGQGSRSPHPALGLARAASGRRRPKATQPLGVAQGKPCEHAAGTKCGTARCLGSSSQLRQRRDSRKPGPRSCWSHGRSQEWGLRLPNRVECPA